MRTKKAFFFFLSDVVLDSGQPVLRDARAPAGPVLVGGRAPEPAVHGVHGPSAEGAAQPLHGAYLRFRLRYVPQPLRETLIFFSTS